MNWLTKYSRKISKFISAKKTEFDHEMAGCKWDTYYNKNSKPYKRTCKHCPIVEVRQNGKWVRVR